MTLSLDLRKRVLSFIHSGGSKVEASRRFSVSRRTIYTWLSRDDLSPTSHGSRQRKIDKDALRRHVRAHPDALLRERAAVFKVSISALSYALKKMGIRKKKNANIWRDVI